MGPASRKLQWLLHRAVLVISARSVVVVVVVACCCCIPYRLVLMLAPTFAPCVLTFAPYILTFRLCAWGVSLLSTGANIPGCHQLQLALVVLFHSATSADSPLAHVVVSPCTTCTGGVVVVI